MVSDAKTAFDIFFPKPSRHKVSSCSVVCCARLRNTMRRRHPYHRHSPEPKRLVFKPSYDNAERTK